MLVTVVWLFATLWTVARLAPLSMVFSRQDTGVGCHFLLQGIFLTHWSNLCLLPWQAGSFPLSHQGSLPTHIFCPEKEFGGKKKKKKIVVVVPKLLSVIVVLLILINILSLAIHLLFKMCCKLLRTWYTHTWVEVSISLTCQVHYNSLVNTRLPFFFSSTLKYSWFGLSRWH